MGSYQQRLTDDMKQAMKAGDKPRLQVVRMLINALKQEQLRLGRDELADDEEVQLLRKAVKTRQDSVAQATQHGRADVAAAETAEIAIIEGYLPAQLTGAELEAKVRALAAEIGWAGPKDMGRFMKEWMARHKGLADGKDVQAALQKL